MRVEFVSVIRSLDRLGYEMFYLCFDFKFCMVFSVKKLIRIQ